MADYLCEIVRQPGRPHDETASFWQEEKQVCSCATVVALVGVWVVKWSKGRTPNHLVFIFGAHAVCLVRGVDSTTQSFLIERVDDNHSEL